MLRRRIVQATVVLVGLALAYLSVAVTLANTTAAKAPTLALRMWPSHGAAHAFLSDAIIRQDPRRPRFGPAAAHAAAALRRDPTLAAAARNLGIALSPRSEQVAVRLLDYAAAMSKRDVPTQLWLLERQVQRNDVEGALSHYAIVLQVSPPMREPLYQVLTGALAQSDLVGPIARMAKNGETWRSGFLTYVVGHANDPSTAVALFAALNSLGEPPPPPLVELLVPRLLAQAKVDAAARLYSLVDPAWRREDMASQLDGGFDRSNDVPPFGWQLDSATATRSGRPDAPRNAALYVNSSASGAVTAARRLLVLRPGGLRIEGSYGMVDPGASAVLRIALTCSNGQRVDEAVVALGNSGRFSEPLTVGACDLNWFSLAVEQLGVGNSGRLWIDDLRLSQAS